MRSAGSPLTTTHRCERDPISLDAKFLSRSAGPSQFSFCKTSRALFAAAMLAAWRAAQAHRRENTTGTRILLIANISRISSNYRQQTDDHKSRLSVTD